jgi:hypothetical protein
MQIYALPHRRSGCAVVALALTVITAHSAELPVTQVILYKHGIAFFAREGAIPAGQEARLDFKSTEMNDVLKSLTVANSGGGRITGIRYDSKETLEQQLDKFPFKVGDQEYLSAFLDRIKGSRIELKSGDRTVTGAIMGARAIETGPDADKRTVREQITLLSENGDLATYDLSAFASMRLLDARLEDQLKQYLQTLARAKSREKRSIYIDSAENAARNLRITYIAPAAIWKSSYRLTLEHGESVLEGWAIVDNTSDEDWTNVKLSVVSGRPISFVSLLDTPRYGRREVAELPEDRAAGPVVYAGGLEPPPPPMAARPDSGIGVVGGTGEASGAAGGVLGGVGSGGGAGGGSVNGVMQPMAPRQFVANQLVQTEEAATSTVEGASGATLGALFEYNFAGPVTINKNQSAMLPFLKDRVPARKLLIYSERDGEHPVNAAEITNDTSKTLDGGPITVYDGGAYAGEALFETLKAGDKRLIGYAVDYGTRITSEFDSGEKTIREIHATDGNLLVRSALLETRTYSIKNVDAQPKTLIIQQEGLHEYSVLAPQPVERTATAYRFEVKLPANGSQTLKVEQERVNYEETVVTSATADFLLTIVQNKQLSATGRQQLQAVVDLKSQAAQASDRLNATKAGIAELTEDQSRLRQDIDILNRVHGEEEQVRKYSSQLAANETQLVALRDQSRDISGRKAALEADLRNAVARLQF